MAEQPEVSGSMSSESLPRRDLKIMEFKNLLAQYRSGELDEDHVAATLADREIHLEKQLDHDEKTGLLTRRGLFNAWARALDILARERRKNPNLKLEGGVIAFDGDRLRDANAHGHGVGDDYITHIGEVAESSIRPHDYMARAGDKADEYIGVIMGASEQIIITVGLRIRNNIRERNHPILTPLRVATTVCLGIAPFPKDIDYDRLADPEYQRQLLEQTFKKADTAQIVAKDKQPDGSSKRDRVAFYYEDENGQPDIKIVDYAQPDLEGNVPQIGFSNK